MLLGKWFYSNALWLSMIIGVLGYKWLHHGSPLLPTLIFLMLFFTFCKIDPKDLRLRAWHWLVLAVQLIFGFAAYYGLLWVTNDTIVAQGLMMCFIMPTATAAPIIAGKLGGSIQNLTTFTLLSNFATALVVPVFFPLIYPLADMTFLSAFLLILRRISPLLLGPFVAAWLLRLAYNFYQRNKQKHHPSHRVSSFELPQALAPMPFYLWVGTIVFLMAQLTNSIITDRASIQLSTITWLVVGSFFACLIQFIVGKYIGWRLPAQSIGKEYNEVLINPNTPRDMNTVSSITAGQAFGQKNTTLGVWMAQTYLNPLSALGAAAYIIWQNIFNSAQLSRAAHGKKI